MVLRDVEELLTERGVEARRSIERAIGTINWWRKGRKVASGQGHEGVRGRRAGGGAPDEQDPAAELGAGEVVVAAPTAMLVAPSAQQLVGYLTGGPRR